MDKKALIAMSGGVDSSVAALLMKEKGFGCIGVTMKLFQNELTCVSKEKPCCSLDDVEDARSVAYRLGMPYYVFNFTDAFESQVIDRFISAYEHEETPNPCIDCNRFMKFDKLYQRAVSLGCDSIVTGHYARIEQANGRYLLKKALDPEKDQSYVLYFVTQEQLAHTQFPLGEMSKAEIRTIAEKQGFVNANKPDSQDICFVPNGDYAKVIEMHTGKAYPHGHFVDRNGTILGEHKGIIRYTIGQRKGLGLSLKEPMYVCEKREKDNTVVLGKAENLFSRELDAKDMNWIAFEKPPIELRVKAKIRYRQTEQWATVTPTGSNTVHICFDEPQRAIAKGQAVVLYDGDIVVAGGTIC
jgi:tRNA-specific 2-thiouridylase